MKKLRVFEAFAGYGSQAIAAKRLQRDFPDEVEFEFIGTSEIEPNAIKAYAAIHGDTPNFGDISKIDWAQVPDFDLLTYSFPCTDISNAGKQAGFSEGSETRSSLLWECEKAIRDKRPKYLLMENVKALVQKKFMPDFRRWIELLESYGYANFWQVLNAKDFGVAQNRERVFMVSILRTDADPNPHYNFPQGFPLDKCVEDYMVDAEEIDESFFIDQERVTGKVLSDILDQPNVRAEEGKLIRRQYKNDIGVPYQACKQYQLNQSGTCDCITTFTTDNNIIEMTDNKPDMELTYHPNPTKEDLLEYFGRGRRIRVRKMVPKEAGRLMGLYDDDIEKIESCPFKTYAEREEAIARADKKELNRIKRETICKTAQYKLYGNSIVVDQLYHLFRTMFIPGQPEYQIKRPIQLTIFDL